MKPELKPNCPNQVSAFRKSKSNGIGTETGNSPTQTVVITKCEQPELIIQIIKYFPCSEILATFLLLTLLIVQAYFIYCEFWRLMGKKKYSLVRSCLNRVIALS